MTTGTGSFRVPVPVFSGSQGGGQGAFQIPMPVMEGYGGGSGAITVPSVVLAGSGSAGRGGYGTFVVPIPVLTGSAIVPVVRGAGVFTLPIPSLSGSDAIRGSGAFVVPLPVFFNISPEHGVGSFIVPVPDFTGSGYSVPSEIYKCVVMNIANQGISTYNAYNFNSLSRFNGQYFGAKSNGIYLLEGDKDGSNYILAKLKTGMLNFGNDFIKNLRDVWLTYRSNGNLALVFATREDEGDRTQEFPTEIADTDIHEERVKVPRGLRGRYFIIELKNLSGSHFDIEQISLMVESIRKRIR